MQWWRLYANLKVCALGGHTFGDPLIKESKYVMPSNDLDLGQVREGIVEIDPMTGRMVLRCQGEDGSEYFDVQSALEAYRGEEVRVVIVPFTTINRVSELIESGQLPLDEAPRAGGELSV